MKPEKTRKILELINREVVPAIGCTEPAAVSLCVARATELLGSLPEKLTLTLSGNIIKNAMGVGIPGTLYAAPGDQQRTRQHRKDAHDGKGGHGRLGPHLDARPGGRTPPGPDLGAALRFRPTDGIAMHPFPAGRLTDGFLLILGLVGHAAIGAVSSVFPLLGHGAPSFQGDFCHNFSATRNSALRARGFSGPEPACGQAGRVPRAGPSGGTSSPGYPLRSPRGIKDKFPSSSTNQT